jgi:putative endonuclease
MTMERQHLGRLAEDYVAVRLERAGWHVLARNARPAGMRGELDIVARHGRELVFVEVKARRTGAVRGPETPVAMVDTRKQARLRRLAGAWLRERGPGSERFAGLRFDVAGVWVGPRDEIVDCEYLRAAF